MHAYCDQNARACVQCRRLCCCCSGSTLSPHTGPMQHPQTRAGHTDRSIEASRTRDTSGGGLLQRWVKREHIQSCEYLERTAQPHATQRRAEPTQCPGCEGDQRMPRPDTAHTEPAHAHTATTPFAPICECAPQWFAPAGRASRTSRERTTSPSCGGLSWPSLRPLVPRPEVVRSRRLPCPFACICASTSTSSGPPFSGSREQLHCLR